MKKILVTGATSFIASYLINELQKQNNVKIYALVRSDSPNINRIQHNKNIIVIHLDFNNVIEINKYVKRIDLCYHLAWNGTRGDFRYDGELQESNFKNSINLYNAVKELGCKMFIGIGSQAEYGFNQDIITEETIPNPNTEYGKYKLKTCSELSKLASEDGVRFLWGRVFSIYGKGDYENTLIMSSLRKMKNNETIDMTDGTQHWNYLYVEDLARILVQLSDSDRAKGIINLASDDNRLLKDYIFEMKKVLNSKSIIRLGIIPYRNEGKVEIRPDISKLLSILSFNYSFTNFGEVIKNIVC